MKVTIERTPVSGERRATEVEVTETGASLGQVLKEANLSHEGMNLSVNGTPADLTTHVLGGAKISLTEKVRGS